MFSLFPSLSLSSLNSSISPSLLPPFLRWRELPAKEGPVRERRRLCSTCTRCSALNRPPFSWRPRIFCRQDVRGVTNIWIHRFRVSGDRMPVWRVDFLEVWKIQPDGRGGVKMPVKRWRRRLLPKFHIGHLRVCWHVHSGICWQTTYICMHVYVFASSTLQKNIICGQLHNTFTCFSLE